MHSETIQNHVVNDYGIKELISLLFSHKLLIFIITSVFAIGSITISLLIPNTYQSDILLESGRDNENSLGQSAAQLGQLASLAGFSIAGGKGTSISTDLALLESRAFLTQYIEKNDILIPLFAGTKWNHQSEKLILNEDIYSESEQKWTRPVKGNQKPKPSLLEASIEFKKLLTIDHDISTGLVSISIEFLSPALAQSWLQSLIEQLNFYVKDKEIAVIKKNISYLEAQAKLVENTDVRAVFYGLLEEQQKKVMLAQSSEEYVFKVLDPAVIPERKFAPKRALICVLGTMTGFFLAIVLVFLQRYFKE